MAAFMKGAVFFLTGCILFLSIQRLFVPKWNYPGVAENMTYTLESFYRLEKDTEDILFLGTSHMEFAVSPMEIYRNEGISSYNLGTSGQPIATTYTLIREALKTQSPRVIVLDVSSLFFGKEGTGEPSWRYVIDTMPMSGNKTDLIRTYCQWKQNQLPENDLGADRIKDTCSGLLPLMYYHSRWSELVFEDFRDYLPSDKSYASGYFPYSRFAPAEFTLDQMNAYAADMSKDIQKTVVQHSDGVESVIREEDHLYDPQISEENGRWLMKIRELCENNHTELLLIKVPSICNPLSYPSAWTDIRSAYMKEYASTHGFKYLDLVYDVDLGLDMDRDFLDGGMHLNHLGTKKTSAFLGGYLADHYAVPAGKNRKMDADMALYLDVTGIAEMELETDLCRYLELLGKNAEKYLILLAARDDMSTGLSAEDILSLHELGLQADFISHPGQREAYLAVIDGGEILYEAASNRTLEYDTQVNGNMNLHLGSAGWMTGAKAEIRIDEKEYAVNGVGMNIVVVDRSTGNVVDSVSFNTYAKDHTCKRNNSMTYLDDYWMAVS